MNIEISMGAHPWEPDIYVAWLRFDNGTIKLCDSYYPKAFKVYRRRETAALRSVCEALRCSATEHLCWERLRVCVLRS